MPRLLITCHHLRRHIGAFGAELDALGIEPVLPPIPGQQLSAGEMRRYIAGCAAVIAGDDVIDADVLEAGHASGLRAVIKWGIGTDSIDKEAAARLAIPVFNTPGVFADEVADLAIAYLLLLARPLHKMHGSVVANGWQQIEGRSLWALGAGIIGLGSIGRAIARRCQAFGMEVIGHDVCEPGGAEPLPAIRRAAFTEVLGQSDVVFLACNLTAENRHMMNERAFAQMRRGSYLINVARGPLIDETALCAALESGRLAGAGLDVFESEPLPDGSPLRRFGNCVFGTHCGSNTAEAVARVNRMTIDIMRNALGLGPAGFVPNRVA